MSNRIQAVTFRNNCTDCADVTYDVLDNTGAPTTLGGTITVPLTAAQVAAFIGAVQATVDDKVAADLTAWQAQAANTAAK